MKWYVAHSFNPADDFAVQNIPDPGDYTDLQTGDHCIAFVEGLLHVFVYDETETSTEAVPAIITAAGNAGNGRWVLTKSYVDSQSGFPVDVGPDTSTTISFTDGTLTFSIQPTVTDFDFYVDGVRHTSTGDTVVITDVEGLHWIYYDTDGVLKVQAPGGNTDSLILTKCLVGNVYWDATNNESVLVGDERHGFVMSPATHYHFHECFGAKYDTGLSLANFDIDGSGNDATAAQFDVTDGEIHDEDIEVIIEDGSPQQLVNATIPTLYRSGVGGAWRKLTPTANFPVADGTIDLRLDWNDYNAGDWRLQEVPNADYVLTHYFATNDINTPIFGVMGQATYGNVVQARTGAETEAASITLAGLPGAEYVLIGTVIWQTDDGYTNAVAARLRSTDSGDDYIDWRQTTITSSGSSTVDHESLANLLGGAAGDHYHLTGTNAGYIDQNVTSGAAPTFTGTNFTGIPMSGILSADKTGVDPDLVTGTKGDASDLSIWNADGDLVGAGKALSEIGVLDTAAEWTAQQGFNESTLTSSSNAVAWNCNSNQCAVHTLTENTTFGAPTNQQAGTTYQLRLVQAAGLYTVAWNAVFKWGNISTPAAPAASGDVVVFSFYSDGTNMYGVEANRTEA